MARAVTYRLGDADFDSVVQVCAAALGRGEVVWAHVDGVSCLIADAFSPSAVALLLQARQRGRGAGLPVLVRDASVVHALFSNVDIDATALMSNYWPGPLTLIGAPSPSLHWDLGAAGQLSGVSVRMPTDAFISALVAATGPCVYLSSNPSAEVESAAEAQTRMGDSVACYVDPAATTTDPALRTSIVDVRANPCVLLREGAITYASMLTTCPGLVRGDGGQVSAQ